MPNWSPAQAEAIHCTGKNVVVSASAGSGKTAVLTARMVKRITQDRIPVENLLAMTFTDAAASEMKNRLYAGLNDIVLTTEEEDLKAYCLDQCAMMGSAMICTIHSFCLQIIKENYFVIGLSPERITRIFSEDEMLIIKKEAIKKTLRFLYHQDPKRMNLAASHFSGRADEFKPLEETIMKIVNLALNQSDAEAFFQHLLEKSQQPARFDLMDQDILNYLFLKIQVEMNQLKTNLEQLDRLCFENQLDQNTMQSVQLKLKKFIPIFDAIQALDYREFVRILRNAASSPLKNDKDEEYKKVRKQINESFQHYVTIYYDSDTVFYDNTHLMPIVTFLIDAASLMLSHLQQAKKEKEGLDFSDMEHLAYAILCANEGAVAKRYQRRFQEILVDEFQDTNDFQNAMIEMISRGNNIFRVGDIKQSIYRFRGAKPQIMADLMKLNDDNHETIVLHHNYRSNKSVVEFNNVLFDIMMNVPGLNNEFSQNDHAQIGTPAQDDQYQWPVQFLKIAASDDNPESKEKAVNPKAIILAHKILEMKNTTEFNHWRDYCVLVRSHAIKDEIRFVFDTLNIPYTTTLMSGFFKSYSIRILTAYLELLCDDTQNIACISVLTGMYGFSDEACSQLQLMRNTQSYHKAACKSSPAFKEDYYQLKKLACSQGILAVLQQMLQIQNFYWGQLDNQERANVDLFMQKAMQAEQISSSIELFLDQIHNCIDQPSGTAISASKNDDVVQITTVHQSKGLQYPVVFYWSDSLTVINDELSGCMVDEKLGLGLYHVELPYRYKRPTLQRMAITMKNALEEYEENVRLYYVALTRAQKVCILLDKVSDKYCPSPLSLSTFFAKKGSTDLILSALCQTQVSCYREDWISSNYRSEFIAEKQEGKQTSLPVYPNQKTLPSLTIETPSSYEESELGPLTFTTTGGKQRGLRLHHAIELLPAPPWNKTMIYSVDPNLKRNEIDALLQLGKQELFIQLHHCETHKEYAFATRSSHRIMHGFVDFIAIGKDTITLVDFKSDGQVTAQQLIKRYQAQLDGYQENLQRIFLNKQIKKLIYSFSLNQFIEL